MTLHHRDEQHVAIQLRKILVRLGFVDIQPIPAGGVMLREDGYQFSVEAEDNDAVVRRYVVIIKREP